MKKETHPVMNDVIFRDSGGGVDFKTKSTMKSDKVENIDGVDYFVISVEVSSATHPFYTGKENVIDTAGRVEKFKQRQSKKSVTPKAIKEKKINTKETIDLKGDN